MPVREFASAPHDELAPTVSDEACIAIGRALGYDVLGAHPTQTWRISARMWAPLNNSVGTGGGREAKTPGTPSWLGSSSRWCNQHLFFFPSNGGS